MRHGTYFIGVLGEKLLLDGLAAILLLLYITEKALDPEQVYNMNKAGFNFEHLP